MRLKIMILVAVLVLCAALFLYKDTIMNLVGFASPSDDGFADLDSIPSIQTPQEVAPIPNNNIRITSSNCSKDNAGACLDSAKKYMSEKDTANALGVLTRGCEYQNAESCAMLANMYNDDNIMPKSQYLYLGYIDKACALGSMESCYDLGVAYYRGDDLAKKDFKKSSELFQRVCDSGRMEGCNNLAVIYNNGGAGIKKDLKLARSLFDRACKSGYEPSCSNLKKVFN